MSKIDTLNNYIHQIDEISEMKDLSKAERMQKEIIGVYNLEVGNLTAELDTYNMAHLYDSQPCDYLGDLKLLKSKLINYRDNLEMQEHKDVNGSVTNFNITQSQNNTQNAELTFTQTISAIDTLSSEVLSEEEKDAIKGKLLSINTACNKNQRWEKIQNALKWIADKSVDVGIAILPYIVNALSMD